MKRIMLVVALMAVAVGASRAAADHSFPDVIRLPDGFQPEGIAISDETFYVGSIPTGAIYRGSLRTGRGSVFVPGGEGKAAVGLAIDPGPLPSAVFGGRLFVAGGPTGKAFVYSLRTGEEVATYQLTTGPTFVNDVVVTHEAAWFTDSINQVLYRVATGFTLGPHMLDSPVSTIPLTGDISYKPGFNVNGIDATPDGETLVVVQSNTGKLFTVTTAGVTREIDLGGGSVPNGDGILLDGRTLYVVQNRDNKIAKIELAADLRSGRITGYITDPDFDVPTTIDDKDRWLYAVNARFGTPNPAAARYDVVRVPK